MHIGIAGVGTMGSNIGARLMEVGRELTVWNRSAEKTKPLADAGASVAKTPAELASAVDVVITILTNAEAIDAVYFGPQGLLAADVKGKLFIEMSTVPPDVEVALAEKVRAKGGCYVECPVGGSVIPARGGKLLGLMGAEPADAARARPILDQICRRVMHAGPVGSGAVLKLAVNLPLMIYWQALGEQLAMCQQLSIAPAELLDFLSETSGAATVLKQRMPGIVSRLKKEPSSARFTFSLDGGIKDVKAMLAEGQRRGLELPLLQQTLACYEEAKRTLTGNDEVSNVAPYWANRKKTLRVITPTDSRSYSCQASPSRKPPPSSIPRSRKGARPIARRFRWSCSMPAGILSRSSARTVPASCGSTSPSARRGVLSAWALVHARLPSGPRRLRSSSPCSRPRAAGAWSPIQAAC
jgi:3-hydroxyisobutyrate dehydrogenase